MLFSTPIFLFGFLPLVLALYYFGAPWWRNAVLLAASLAFYGWGEGPNVLLMLGTIAVSHCAGGLVARSGAGRAADWWTAGAVGVQLGLLVAFKYGNFIVGNLAVVLPGVEDPVAAGTAIDLPIGVSFFTFQAISYVVDVRRGHAAPQRNPFQTALYIALFPQLIAGPIVRYTQIAAQLSGRRHSVAGFAAGVRRFCVGLARKVCLADVLARPADAIFALDPAELPAATAWLGLICFTLQVYHDFAGYSDMAIGLGRMFGFRIPENFDTPYVSRSFREFWRRWHLTLSAWFRDYVYIPLGGSRRAPARVAFNLVLVFTLCGFWHGAAWTFVVWGLSHGLFLSLERLGGGRWLENRPAWLQHGYFLTGFILTLAVFRSADLAGAAGFYRALFGFSAAPTLVHAAGRYCTAEVLLTLLLATATAARWTRLRSWWRDARRTQRPAVRLGTLISRRVLLPLLLLLAAAAHLVNVTGEPFIYFRF